MATAGASAALGGLVLVFLGVLITTYQELLGEVGLEDTRAGLKMAGRLTLGVFGICLVSLVMGVAWLAGVGGDTFYAASLVVFFIQLAAVASAATWTTLGVLLRG